MQMVSISDLKLEWGSLIFGFGNTFFFVTANDKTLFPYIKFIVAPQSGGI